MAKERDAMAIFREKEAKRKRDKRAELARRRAELADSQLPVAPSALTRLESQSISLTSDILSPSAPSSIPCSPKALPKKRGRPPKATTGPRSDRRAPVAKQQKQIDHFATNRSKTIGLYELLVDENTRDHRFIVQTHYELHKKLQQYRPDLAVARSTLTDWFTVPGKNRAPAFPSPKSTFAEGVKAGYNINKRKSPGRLAILNGAEKALDEFATVLEDMRTAGISLNVSSMRSLLLAILLEHGHKDLINPHLLSPEGMILRTSRVFNSRHRIRIS
jgi:hypothetical protein